MVEEAFGTEISGACLWHLKASNSPDMRNIVELRDNGMQEFRACESILDLNLRSEMSKNDDCGFVFSHEDRSNKQLEMGKPLRITNVSGWYARGTRPQTETPNSLWIGSIEF